MAEPAGPQPSGSARREIVLVGGGHSHVQVMVALAERPPPDTRVTLVSPVDETPYSGMLPGHIAGLYRREEIHIDLVRLAAATGTHLIRAAAAGLDRAARRLRLDDGDTVPYDVVSFNIGISPDLAAIEGAETHAVAIKPIALALDTIQPLRRMAADPTGGPLAVAVVGGGAAGVEVSLALAAGLRRTRAGAIGTHGSDEDISVILVSSGPPLADMPGGFRRRAVAALGRAGIAIETGRAIGVDETAVVLSNGRRIAADAVVICTGARPPAVLRATGLALANDGSLAVRDTLQAVDDDDVFGAGDCVRMQDWKLEKAGVYAVRQGPVLADNIRRRILREPLSPYRPQRRFLVLLGLGDGTAIGVRGRLPSVEGRWVWWWKDRIDRAFVDRFRR